MRLNTLNILGLRNLKQIDLELHPEFNVFWGNNGSGKTSLLEAVHLLATGKSFRTPHTSQIITFGQNSCVVAGDAASFTHSRVTRMGIERFQTGKPKIRLAEEDCQSLAELARMVPLQLINTHSYDILSAPPLTRREFLDWALFHIEHSFYGLWQRYRRVLHQRNAALKERRDTSFARVGIWDKELVEVGEAIGNARARLLAQLLPVFSEELGKLLFVKDLKIQYHQGWNSSLTLQEALERHFERDLLLGYTTQGPHRADLEFELNGEPAKAVLSRGQSKLFVCALLISRGKLLFEKTERRCLFLLDDLRSELDKQAGALLLNALQAMRGQVWVTSIEQQDVLELLSGISYKMFHVEQGEVREN